MKPIVFFASAALWISSGAVSVSAEPSESAKEEVARLATGAIEEGQASGVVVAVGGVEGIRWQGAWGDAQVLPHKRPMRVDSVFDLASLTKSVATATAVMQLVERGQVDLDAPVATYLPGFAARGKDAVTVADLLTHQGGLIADNAMKDYRDGEAETWRRLLDLPLRHKPQSKFVYSDVGFLILGRIVEEVSGRPLEEYCRDEIFEPLGMKDTSFVPPPRLRERAVATEQRDGTWLVGEVHDPRAAALGGVAGHAGLFSTAEDLSRFARALLNGGRLGDAQVLRPETVKSMTTRRSAPGDNIRGLGWDMESAYSSNRSDRYSAAAFGHGGFTGTSLWIDPEQDLFVIFLSSRLHPDGKGSVNRVAAAVGTAVLANAAE